MVMGTEPRLRTTRHMSFRSICIGICLSVWIVATATAEDEKEILETFFIASEGEQWIVKTNWATEEPICSWFGVTCGFNLSNVSGVIALELPGNNVAREISELIYQMPFLETLDLRHNPIVNPGLTGMGRAAQGALLSPLKSINFGYCLLTKVDGIQDAPETLVDLQLTKNQITAGFPSEILSLTNLQSLYLNFNGMEGSLPRKIGNLKRLKELYLFSNKMTGTLPSEIGSLDKMEFFTLGDNNFHGSIPQEVNDMLNLQIFSLHASEEGVGKLTGKLPSFANAGYLEKVYLSNNALTGGIPDDFLKHNSNTGEIVSINLKYNKISGRIPDSLGRFDNLDLDLVGNEIEGPLPESFCYKGRWMSGLVEQYGCNAILCPPGFYNEHGMQVEDQHPCIECEAFQSPYFGATECGSPPRPPELKILAELYITLQGRQWEQNDGWNQFDTLIQNSDIDSADLSELVPCSFYGVLCSNSGLVEILTLGNNGLRGKIPASVFQLPGLVDLDMSYNYVDVDDDTGGFATLKDATKLARLKLSHTNIASLEGIGQAVTLEELYLDGSDFESSLPSELFDLINLRVLHLDASFLTGPLPSDIRRMSSLTRLQLNENKLEGHIPKELGELIDLLHLDLSDNDLGGELPQELNELRKLQTLRINKCRGDLSGNLMTFDRLEAIEELELYSNLFSGSIPSGFLSGKISKSDRIRVRLNGNQLDGAIPADLAEFTNMELDLEDNSISALPQVLCENHDEWMSGEVGLVDGGCDAILCRPGFWSPHGKAVSRLDVTCKSCEANKFFGETTCETTGAVRSREAEILDNFFAATGGRYWSQTHTNWTKPSIPICYREGVKCGEASDDMNSGVTELRLNSFGLRGKIPGEIFELPSILALAFSHNPVDIELFGVGKSETLQVLLLSETDLRNLAGIENAPAQLYEFHAAKNQMVGRFPSQLLQLSNLRKLLLNDNVLTGTIPTEIAGMSALRELGLWDNLMHGSFPTELGQLTDLMELEAQNNFFSGLLPKELGNLSKLERIDLSKQLSDNKLTGPLFDFATNPRLSSVNLSENSFAGTIPADFLSAASETALLTVDLSDNQLSGSIPIELQSFAQLDIRLKGNMIDSIPEALCDIAGWMGGLAGETEFCNAIMCPPGKFAAEGRQTNPGVACQDCNNIEEAPYFGSTSCAKVDIERTVLIEFYKDMDGRNWAFQDKWLSDESVCTWYGIECNAKSSVVAIRLKNNRLVNARTNGDGSTSLFNLPNLEIVDLQADNNLGLDLRNIPLDSQLKSLILSSTGLKSLEGVNRAKNLQTLRIAHNKLSGSFPSEVLEVTTLRELYLSFNSIIGTIPAELAALTNLEKLYLSRNDLSGVIPSEIAALPELREVGLSENLLSGLIPEEVSRLPFLTKFEANHQRGKELITGPVPDLAEVPNLVFFDASGNDLTGSIPSNFLAGSLLADHDIYIILANNEITGTIPESLQPLLKLDINLADNQITGIPEVLCDNSEWMGGDVRLFADCLAVLCPAGSFSESGRERVEHPCVPCDGLVPSPFLGQTYCADDTSERLILEYIFWATGGEQWTNNTLWATDAPICSWGGISCNGDKQDDDGVEKIELSFNNMLGTLPSQVWSLSSLRELHLTGNKGLSVSFDGLSNDAASLEKLYLTQVHVQSLTGVSQAPKLTELYVAQCGLTGTLPSGLFELETLEQIDLSWNFFVGTLSTSVGKLTNLSLLEGNGNDFHGTFPTEIGLLSNLENIIFAENLFSGVLPTELSSLPRLKGLSFSRLNKSGRKLSGRVPAFDKTPQLETLVLELNEFTGSLPSNFLSSASGARFVDLSSNLLTGTVPVGLDTISALDIRLMGNMISALPSIFCDNSGWMEGEVGKMENCDVIMCPQNFASPDGRATTGSDCQPCPTEGGFASFYGSTSCSQIANEREILTQFYDACNGQDWYRNDYWKSTAEICDWYGVGCEDGEVVLINLEANHLTGRPNEGLFDLPNLKVLWLGSNNIDFSFRNIESARKLMELQLDQIGLRSVEGLDAAKGLVSLDLSFNLLEGAFPEELLALENMRVLNLRSNSFNGPLPPSFANQRFLRHLRLDDNEFWGALPSYSDSTVLWNLYLGSNSIDGAIPNNFLGGVPSHAKVLVDLAGNELSGTVPSSLGRLDDLTIYLRENQFTGLAEALCEKTAWMDGEVGSFGCDAILCANGTSNFIGRQSAEAGKCVKCPKAERGWFGETLCPGPNYSSAGFSVGYKLLGLLLGFGMTLMSLM